MNKNKSIYVEVAYARPDKQMIKKISLTQGATVKDAIEISDIKKEFEEIDLTKQKVGIFSKAANLDTLLRDKDRVEIYRELIADPKEVRRAKLAEKQKKLDKNNPNLH